MPMMTTRELGKAVAELLAAYKRERPRLNKIASYMEGTNQDIYVPRSATTEYKRLVDQAHFNVMPTVVDALVRNLFVDGYRTFSENGRPADVKNHEVWDKVWQPNRMDSRQSALYRAAATYGYSYALVLPGEVNGQTSAVISTHSPLELTAIYDRLDDQWPRLAMVHQHPLIRRAHLYGDPLADPIVNDEVSIDVYDDEFRYRLVKRNGGWSAQGVAHKHGLGVVPVVRYLDSGGYTDRLPPGKVEPLIPAQRQLNQTTFGLLMAQQYAAFKQRWATGMAIVEDENGNPVEPFNAAVNRVWQNESPDGRFGEFEQTDLSGYLESRKATLLYIASVAPLPPHDLLVGAGISNISAEALVALEASHRHDIAAHKTTEGESVEQTIRLAGRATGDTALWNDTSAQVVWRDTTPRSGGQVADMLGKFAQMLDIPPRALWERIPDVTDQDLRRWEAMALDNDLFSEISRLDGGADDEEAARIKAQADALGVLIRAGVDPTVAARQVGLDGLEFTGAIPVSLRPTEARARNLED